jgi:hypothetical protein
LKPEYKKIRTIEELKEASKVEGGAEFFILLNYGLRSSKHICYFDDTKKFWILNCIDDSEGELTPEQILDRSITNIGLAMEREAFYQVIYK